MGSRTLRGNTGGRRRKGNPIHLNRTGGTFTACSRPTYRLRHTPVESQVTCRVCILAMSQQPRQEPAGSPSDSAVMLGVEFGPGECLGEPCVRDARTVGQHRADCPSRMLVGRVVQPMEPEGSPSSPAVTGARREVCRCGHGREDHAGAAGHLHCTACQDCRRYTWVPPERSEAERRPPAMREGGTVGRVVAENRDALREQVAVAGERLAGEVSKPADQARELSPGMTCASCVHFSRCSWLLSLSGDETACDWSPSRFKQREAPHA